MTRPMYWLADSQIHGYGPADAQGNTHLSISLEGLRTLADVAARGYADMKRVCDAGTVSDQDLEATVAARHWRDALREIAYWAAEQKRQQNAGDAADQAA